MEIIIAEDSGFCYGVQRALNIAERTRKAKSGSVVTLGELIHNPQVIAGLRARGIRAAASPDDISEGTVIIRSHGIAPEVRRRLVRKKIGIADATCPTVARIQKLVESLSRTHPEVVIVGSRTHPETLGLLGFSRGKGVAVENESEAGALPRRRKRAVLAQSTQDAGTFGRVVAALVGRTGALSVFDTICRATQARQESTAALASRVDTMFIVGGKTSSNTEKLYRISKRIQRRTFFVESADRITAEMLKGARTIGISGGASTPPGALQEAAARIQKSFESK